MKARIIPLTLLAAIAVAGTAEAQVAPPVKTERHEARGHFQRLDVNKDGMVSRDEYMGERQKRFVTLDKNKDGAISKEEFLAGAKDKDRRGKHFEALDADRNGQVSKAEWDAASARHFDRRDANKDGTWSKEELAATTKGPGKARKNETPKT